MEIKFKDFLLTEENQYFGAKIGDILNAVQDLAQNAQNMGTRHLVRLIQNIVNEIRSILRSRWSLQQRPYLEVMQRVGIALIKAIENHGDIPGTLASAQYALEAVSGKIGTPLNQMAVGDIQ